MDAPAGADGHDEHEVMQRYRDQVRSLHRDWADLEDRGDDSVQLSRRTRSALSAAVRADARHGARVQMPPTDIGPYSVTELALRTLIRDAVDGIDGAVSLRTAVAYAPDPEWGSRGAPERASCRISAAASTPDLLSLAESARDAVRETCARELALPDLVVDIHIEDLHEH